MGHKTLVMTMRYAHLSALMVDGDKQPDIYKPYSEASGSGH